MQALVLHAARDLRIEPIEAADPGPGEVRVAIARGGICGSDLHYYNHGGFGPVRLKEPMILGHEIAGTVVATGDGVTGLKEGDAVAVSPSRPCHACRFCLAGQPQHCLNMAFYGSAMPFPHVQGAFRQELVARADQCVPSQGLGPGLAAMAEPLAVCLHAVKQAGEMLGRSVLITGAGPIGQLMILAARRAGADMIVVTDLADKPLELAGRLGADQTLNMAENPDSLAEFQADKGAFDVVIECSGAEVALAGAIPVLRPGGVLVQLGLGGDMKVPMQAITAKEITLRGSFRFHPEFATAVSLMQKGLIDPTQVISHTLPMSEADAAFALASDRAQAMKVQLDFTG